MSFLAEIAKTRRQAVSLALGTAAMAAGSSWLLVHQASSALAPLLGSFGGLCLGSLATGAVAMRRTRQALSEAETASQHKAAQAALVTRIIDGLVLEHGADGHVTKVATNLTNEFAMPAQAWMGSGFFDRLHVADRPMFLKAVAETRAGMATGTVHVRLRLEALGSIAPAGQAGLFHFDGTSGPMATPVFASVSVRIARSEDPGHARYVSFLRNRSQLVALEQEKAASSAKIEALDQWRGRLLANVSHELRTPLNAIIGFADILKDGHTGPSDAAQQREFAGIIADSGRHLLSLVNSILDMSKIEAGRLTLGPEPFALLPVISECCDMFQIEAARRCLTLTRDWTDAPNLSDVDMVADKRALRQILINLVGNAAKFTPDGGSVKVSLRRQGNFVRLSVRDSGIGMSPEDLKRLGEPFFQAASNYDRAHEGTGLGLALVRGLVGLHGGSLRIESTQGLGTCVSVLLPWDAAMRVAQGDANIDILTGPLPRHGYTEDFLPDQYRMRKIA